MENIPKNPNLKKRLALSLMLNSAKRYGELMDDVKYEIIGSGITTAELKRALGLSYKSLKRKIDEQKFTEEELKIVFNLLQEKGK